jgi:hypothetical protein
MFGSVPVGVWKFSVMYGAAFTVVKDKIVNHTPWRRRGREDV